MADKKENRDRRKKGKINPKDEQPRTKRAEFIPYTIEDEIDSVCDSLIGIINVRRQELREQLTEQRKKFKDLETCRDRAQMLYYHEHRLYDSRNWLGYPEFNSFRQILHKNIFTKEREAYGKFEIAVYCNKKPFLDYLTQITNVYLKVTNPEDMKYQTETYKYENKSIGEINSNNLESINPRGIAIDELKGEYFITDANKNRIIIFDQFGEYLKQFSYSPHFKFLWGIAVNCHSIFISDNGNNEIFKFSRKDFQKICSQGSNTPEYNMPRQLAIYNNDIYLCDTNNDRIVIHSDDNSLSIKGYIEHGSLCKPIDIIFKEKNLYVLTDTRNDTILKFENKNLITTINTKEDIEGEQLLFPFFEDQRKDIKFFCIDKFNNILISYFIDNSIKIFTAKGRLLISKDITYEQESLQPAGIYITSECKIIFAVKSDKYAIQIIS